MARKFKITVIKKFSPEDVFGKEGFQFKSGEKDKICNLFEEGQEFTFEGVKKPEGFPCEWAWNDLFNDIMCLAFGAPFIAFTPCRDGKKPIVFKVERIAEE